MHTEKPDIPLRLYQVDHPDYGSTQSTAQDSAGAIANAANVWGVSFRKIASQCTVTDLGPARRPRCRRCQSEFGSPGDPPGYCMDCQAIRARQERESQRYAAAIRRQEKRKEQEK